MLFLFWRNMLTDKEIYKNFSEIRKFFDKIDTTNKSTVRKQDCSVEYLTDKSSYNFCSYKEVMVNISNRDFFSVELNDFDEIKYHTSFNSKYQKFYFNEAKNCLTIKGTSNIKKFTKYEVTIFI